MDEVIHIRLTPEILAGLVERAGLEGRSKNAMAKMLLTEALGIRPEMRTVPKIEASEKMAVAREALASTGCGPIVRKPVQKPARAIPVEAPSVPKGYCSAHERKGCTMLGICKVETQGE